MGNSEETKSSKQEKSSSPAKDQPNIHVYPDWAAMQMYYGPRVAVPPYFNPPVASGHPAHPYMWGPPQHMIPPYGAPYAAIYAPGGVHAHPGVPIGSTANGHAAVPSPVTTEPLVAIPLSIETPSKSLANSEKGSINKLKGFNGLAMSISSGNAQSGEEDHGMSQSEEEEDSSDGSSENPAALCLKGKKRSREESPSNVGEGKIAASRSSASVEEGDGSCVKVMGLPVVPINTVDKVGATLSPKMTTALELGNASGVDVKTMPSNAPQSCPSIPSEAWLQNERELKRERRKQSNRESARRSRLRKQAEAEELAKKVQCLSTENMTLVSEINELKQTSEQLRLENAKLMDKLQDAKLGQSSLYKHDEMRGHAIGTADLLARVNNSGTVDRNEEGEVFENKRSGAKLRNLLDAGPRTDAVAAG